MSSSLLQQGRGKLHPTSTPATYLFPAHQRQERKQQRSDPDWLSTVFNWSFSRALHLVAAGATVLLSFKAMMLFIPAAEDGSCDLETWIPRMKRFAHLFLSPTPLSAFPRFPLLQPACSPSNPHPCLSRPLPLPQRRTSHIRPG